VIFYAADQGEFGGLTYSSQTIAERKKQFEGGPLPRRRKLSVRDFVQ
jgi:hypothetical protein